LAIRLPRRSGRYRVRVVLTANGRVAADELVLLVGPNLPVSLAGRVYDNTIEHSDDTAWGLRCARRSARRVDCRILAGDPGRRLRCYERGAVEATADGVLRLQRYSCRKRPPASPLRHADVIDI
jgi:hypothetical protein